MSDAHLVSAELKEQQDALERFGIKHVLADVFYYRDYRYGKLEDAIAQAMRDQESAKSG